MDSLLAKSTLDENRVDAIATQVSDILRFYLNVYVDLVDSEDGGIRNRDIEAVKNVGTTSTSPSERRHTRRTSGDATPTRQTRNSEGVARNNSSSRKGKSSATNRNGGRITPSKSGGKPRASGTKRKADDEFAKFFDE